MPMPRSFRWTVPVTLAAVTLAACGDDDNTAAPVTAAAPGPSAVVDPGDGGDYAPEVDPARFVDVIDNPYLPLTVGSRWTYAGDDGDGGAETVEITVLDENRVVMGVTVTVVRDRVTVDGEVVEDTFDWFAQDADGNVWYFGEEVQDYENGRPSSTAGSWEAGVGGALPGIVMPARPVAGAAFRQEFWPGEAEDMFAVDALGQRVTTPAGSWDEAVRTTDWSPLEPEVVEEKYYVAGVGKVAEVHVAGGTGEVRLVSYHLA